MAYITKSNAKKIVHKLDVFTLDGIVESVYKRSIYFFSKRESANLKGIRELFKDIDNFFAEYYHPIEVVDTYQYLYPETKPAYHVNEACERINSRFINIEVPIEIQNKGSAAVIRFRNWFLDNKFAENSEDYIKKVQLAFPYIGPINPRSINYENSGSEMKKDYSLNELEFEIEKILDESEAYFNDNPNIRDLIYRYQKLTFLAHTKGRLKNNHSGLDDEELKSFLSGYEKQFKMPVKERLIEYYRIMFNPEMEFEGTLLDKLGFRPCNACFSISY